jgi:tetratricopeptide (TPR) repeat protein
LTPGKPITINTATEDIQPTDDAELAKRQLDAYPDNPEAAFILAVALTRTSRVEEALKEVRHARRLAEAKGGAQYFDKMIESYEKMLTYCPDDNRVRYDLAWAYYMKAYLLTQDAKRAARDAAPAVPPPPQQTAEKGKNVNAAQVNNVLSMLAPGLGQNLPTSGKVSSTQLPHIPGALEGAPPAVVPQVKQYYELALKNLDDLLAKKPDDMWARVYRAHLYAEYSGDLAGAMKVWQECAKQAPQNPAPAFFLAEAYLKVGNLKESFSNISRALALRALGN